MFGTTRDKVAGLAAVLCAAGLAGCQRDRTASDEVVGPTAALREGAILRGAVVESVALVARPTPPLLEGATRRAFSAPVRRGRATLDEGTLAVSGGLGQSQHQADVTDSLGRSGRVVVEAPRPDAPPHRVRVYREQELLVDAVLDWGRVSGGWVLRRRTLTVYNGGQPVLRHVREVDALSLASAPARKPSGVVAALGRSVLLPAPAEAQIPLRCLDEAAMTVVAAGMVAAATAAVIATPSPVTVGALGTAIAFYDRTMEAYVNCLAPKPSSE